MAVVKAADKLLEYTLCDVFLELASFTHVAQEVSARCDLNDEQIVLLSLEVLE